MQNTSIRVMLLVVSCLYISGCQRPGTIRPDDLAPFTTDGCSYFPEGTPGNSDLWCSCCIEHDHLYWAGGTAHERLLADRALRECVTAACAPDVARTMYLGVRIGGSPYWPTRFRWGYGWPYFRGYKPLCLEERAVVDELWRQYLENPESKVCPDIQTDHNITSDQGVSDNKWPPAVNGAGVD